MSKVYFTRSELECKCCHACKFSDKMFNMINKAREYANIPFVINSAYRCEKHNKEIGGSPTSSHLKGEAVDIKVKNNTQRYIILNALLKAGFTRLGVAETYIHADCDTTKAQNVIWFYK